MNETVIPEAVRKAEEEGEKIRKAMYGEDSKDDDGTLDDTPAPETPATPDPNDIKGDDAPKEDKDVVVDPEDPPKGLEDKATNPDDKANEEDWKHKHDVINGKYLAEIPRLSTEIKYLKGELVDRDAKILVLEQAKPEPSKEANPKDNSPDLTAALETLGTELGSDALDAIKTVIAGHAAPVDTDLKDRVNMVEENSARHSKLEFNRELDTLAPDWRVLNKDEGFLNWLDDYDPVAGKPYGAAIQEASNSLDSARVAAIFNLYPQPEDPKVEPKKETKKDIPNVAPNRGTGGGQIPQTKESKIYSGAEVERFYRDVQKGFYKTKPKMRTKIEADINLAAQEGRIRG